MGRRRPGLLGLLGPDRGGLGSGGKSLPHYSVAQYTQSTRITAAQLAPGDLVFWGSSSSPGSIYHVALYIGGGQIIHAPRTGPQRQPGVDVLLAGTQLLRPPLSPVATGRG